MERHKVPDKSYPLTILIATCPRTTIKRKRGGKGKGQCVDQRSNGHKRKRGRRKVGQRDQSRAAPKEERDREEPLEIQTPPVVSILLKGGEG
ncbi:hypothetical protein PoB_006049800 [Plakobranchus ocellatus]|uniref:Uncharacterized protein n=1 Tax=Plakobranchus ocellatus TaxID=259542 RepID=A0AAV4CQ37_9GAST|nr:hypothetical protein PoB_006049800 [Plakobranchus ocellatus]